MRGINWEQAFKSLCANVEGEILLYAGESLVFSTNNAAAKNISTQFLEKAKTVRPGASLFTLLPGPPPTIASCITGDGWVLVHLRHPHDGLEAVRQLAGGVAHHLNNALAAISTKIQLLLEEGELSDGATLNLRLVEEIIERTSKVINDLLQFAGELSPSFMETNLKDLLESSIKDARDRTEGMINYSLRTVSPVYTDPQLLEEALAGLIEHFAAENPAVTISLSEDEEGIYVDISLPSPPQEVMELLRPFKELDKGMGAAKHIGVLLRLGLWVFVNPSPSGSKVILALPKGVEEG